MISLQPSIEDELVEFTVDWVLFYCFSDDV